MLQDPEFFAEMAALHGPVLLSLQQSVQSASQMALSVENLRKAKLAEEMLPPRQEIAPNQHSWPETAVVMGVPVKGKRKVITDPYSGGEKSGKKAKKDARGPSLQVPPIPAPTEPPVIPTSYSFSNALPFIRNAPFFTTTLSSPGLPADDFNPSLVNPQDGVYLSTLKRPQLNKLCYYHNIPAAGKNSDIISALQNLK